VSDGVHILFHFNMKFVGLFWTRYNYYYYYYYYYYYFQLCTAAFKAYCAIWVRRSNFRHKASSRVSPRESTQRRKMELWARNVR